MPPGSNPSLGWWPQLAVKPLSRSTVLAHVSTSGITHNYLKLLWLIGAELVDSRSVSKTRHKRTVSGFTFVCAHPGAGLARNNPTPFYRHTLVPPLFGAQEYLSIEANRYHSRFTERNCRSFPYASCARVGLPS